MYLKYLQIVNFKNLKSSRFEFSKGTNTIIGENDSGKSNALTAMRILLDENFFFNARRLSETDFSYELDNWRGHWIIISAFFDEITDLEKKNEVCAEISPFNEDQEFLKSYIRSKGEGYGTVTLFIRPNKALRTELFNAEDIAHFNTVRSKIKLSDYEFVYTARSQADFTDIKIYNEIVGNITEFKYTDPDEIDDAILGTKLDIHDVRMHLSLVFIDALRDVEAELKKSKNPIRRIIETLEGDIAETDIMDIKQKIIEINQKVSCIPKISSIGYQVNAKLVEMIGLVYSPNIKIESKLKEDFVSLAKFLSMTPADQQEIDLLGLGHLNMLYMALKLVEFEFNRNHEILNIMVIEEPEAHIHTHIQKTLFDNLQMTRDYTQVIMTTHSTHISEVAAIEKINVLKKIDKRTIVMRPTTELETFGSKEVNNKNFITCLTRYLDAKRNVLLFSKGVILVEGDGEEILIPALVRKVLGISLDEIGIGLINIGGVAFENIACVFDEKRLQRNCSIITDSDTVIEGASKSNLEADKRGKSRKEKLDTLFSKNPFVETFYSSYTFEIDFAFIENNVKFIKEILNNNYKSPEKIKEYGEALDNDVEAKKYDTIITIVNHIKKGWYATLLATCIDITTQIPEYILDAIAFASQNIIDEKIKWKIIQFAFDRNDQTKIHNMNDQLKATDSKESKKEIINAFRITFPDDMASVFFNKIEQK